MTIYKSTNRTVSSSSSSINIKDYVDENVKSDYDLSKNITYLSDYKLYSIKAGNEGFKYESLLNDKIDIKLNYDDKLQIDSYGKHNHIYCNLPSPNNVKRFFVSINDGSSYVINGIVSPKLYLFNGYKYQFIIPIHIYDKYNFTLYGEDKKEITYEKKYDHQYVFLDLFVTGNNSKISYGGNIKGNEINFLDLSEYQFLQDKNEHIGLDFFSYKYVESIGDWRAFFPQNINLDVFSKSENNSNFNKGLKVCYYFNGLESPKITLSTNKMYRIINNEFRVYPIKFYKTSNSSNEINYISSNIKVIDNQFKDDPNVYISVYGLHDPYYYLDEYDPYYENKEFIKILYYDFTPYSYMGNFIEINDNGISFVEAHRYFSFLYRYPRDINFINPGKYMFFEYEMENFGRYFMVTVGQKQNQVINEAKGSNIFDFLNRENTKNIFKKSPYISPDDSLIVDILDPSIDNLIKYNVVDAGLKDKIKYYANKFDYYDQKSSIEYNLYLDAIKRLIKDISLFYPSSYFAINSPGENIDNELIKLRYELLNSIPTVKYISLYCSSSSVLYSLSENIKVNSVISIGDSEIDTNLVQIKIVNNRSYFCDSVNLVVDTRNVIYCPISNVIDNKISTNITYENINKIYDGFKYDVSYDRALFGPIVFGDLEGVKFSKDILYIDLKYKNVIKSTILNYLSLSEYSENIIMIYDYRYENAVEVERLFLFYSELGFSSICMYMSSDAIYKYLDVVKNVSELFNMKLYIYINKYTEIDKINNPCAFYYLGDVEKSSIGSLNYNKIYINKI